MYQDFWRSLKQGWLFILLLSLVIEGLPFLLGDSDSMTGGTIVGYAVYAYYMHRFLLLDEALSTWRAAKPTRPHRIGRFILVTGLLFAVVVAIGFYGTFRVTEGLRDDRFLGVFLLITILANLVVLSLFGTVLPAAAVGDGIGLSATLGRTRATFLRIFGGLIGGPGVVGAVGFATILFLGNALSGGGPISGTVEFGIGLLARALSFVNTTFAVVVLCRAYLSVLPAAPVQEPA